LFPKLLLTGNVWDLNLGKSVANIVFPLGNTDVLIYELILEKKIH
jgi:hypothetical protein